jgi:ankyrin repeat protein
MMVTSMERAIRLLALGFVTLFLSSFLKASPPADPRLIEAVKKGDHKAVRELIQNHADVNSAQPDGSTALILAANSNDMESADLLIKAGANVNARNEYGATALFAACNSDNTVIVKLLLGAKADPNLALPLGETTLMCAVNRGNLDSVRALLEHGADVNAKETEGGQTPVMWAAANKNPDIVKILIENKADTQAQSKGGSTALIFAAQQGDLVSTRALLDAGANPNQTGRRDALTPLLLAAESFSAEVETYDNKVPILLADRGANTNAVDGGGYTALHYASGCMPDTNTSCKVELSDEKRVEVVKALLAHGANPNARLTRVRGGDGVSLKGATPIFFAAATGHAEVARVLVAGGADPFSLTDGKTAPLHLAAGVGPPNGRDWTDEEQKKMLDTTKFFVGLGADVNAVAEHKWTPLHGAAYKGLDSIVQFLVEKGAKMNVFDEYGQTPLSIANAIITVGGKYAYGNSPRELHATTRDLLLKLGATPVEKSGVEIFELFHNQPD